ncbi:hypothetical protein BG844_20805 [Couchioplanes caeruleus subsp. caeruleus]|uniref:Uncharacterized protein n=1 Tax=Couchioplanes caeruleus subsp. caeruleus TaxID=56427 RepID=A0A1K0GJE9_9ACTN|nr:hypothetical protein BG844_20805 [Couchioplanes caeruleus subsp. caeruleus]
MLWSAMAASALRMAWRAFSSYSSSAPSAHRGMRSVLTTLRSSAQVLTAARASASDSRTPRRPARVSSARVRVSCIESAREPIRPRNLCADAFLSGDHTAARASFASSRRRCWVRTSWARPSQFMTRSAPVQAFSFSSIPQIEGRLYASQFAPAIRPPALRR